MPRRPATALRLQVPSSPRRRWDPSPDDLRSRLADVRSQDRRTTGTATLHPLTDGRANAALHAYDTRVKEAFDRLVPVLKRVSALQHEDGFEQRAQDLARAELGFELPPQLLETAWVTQLDMRTLYAWCLFETYEQTSAVFFSGRPPGWATRWPIRGILRFVPPGVRLPSVGCHPLRGRQVGPCGGFRSADSLQFRAAAAPCRSPV